MKNFTKVLFASLAAATLFACGSDNDEDSYLRIYHASPDAPKVNIWLDGKLALAAVDYQQSSGAVKVAAGMHTVQVEALLPDGTTLTVIPETQLTLEKDTEYNVVAAGKAALIGSGEVNEFAPQIIARDYLTPADARLQVMHAAPDAPMVDVFVTGPDADLAGATPFADDLEYLGVTQAISVAAGNYRVRITDPNNSQSLYFDSGTVTVPVGGDWFVAATNNTEAGESPVNLLVDTGETSFLVRDKDTGSDLRVVHAISDAPAVDVWVNGSAPAEGTPLYNLAFTDVTDYLAVGAAEYTFDVAVNGSDPVTVVEALTLTATLEPSKTYTAIAIGNLTDELDNDQLYVVEDEVRRVATAAKLRAIHASTKAGNVDIYISDDATPSDDDLILKNVAYKGDSTVLSVTPGEVYIMITPPDDMGSVVIGPAMLNLTAGSLTTLIASDDTAEGFTVISLDD
ncbi:MAG: hypothetical protein ACJAZP_003519 [Psychromonas sp.]|jgi:hypothetical protein|uniref:DUF4397 domain-containing protein n=1 Tax=Psychromonas sp. TaxID=1884585 RepID=UPI0039E6B430